MTETTANLGGDDETKGGCNGVEVTGDASEENPTSLSASP